MARRAVISSGVLKGYLLEEVVASLIRNAGYRLLTRPEDDPHDLSLMSNGLQVRGRGGFHQADVLGELTWAPVFGNLIRLFIEAKWRGHGRGRVGIPETRHAVGILRPIVEETDDVAPAEKAVQVVHLLPQLAERAKRRRERRVCRREVREQAQNLS